MGTEEGSRLFAPWRFTYVSGETSTPGCVFCNAARGDEHTLTLRQGERAFALLNRYPYTSGHSMVAPVRHTASFESLEPETLAEMMAITREVLAALEKTYHPHGFNLGLNLGEAAGAGIEDHLHLHVVPRWRGDTNFMTVSGGVRVIPEDLGETWTKVRRALEEGRA